MLHDAEATTTTTGTTTTTTTGTFNFILMSHAVNQSPTFFNKMDSYGYIDIVYIHIVKV
jgi:hypothetical protein